MSSGSTSSDGGEASVDVEGVDDHGTVLAVDVDCVGDMVETEGVLDELEDC